MAALHSPSNPRMQEVGSALYAALIRPVEQFLSGATSVIVVPTQPLVPLHTLRRSSGRSATKYFIQDRSVSYLPVVSSLRSQEFMAPTSTDVVALGHRGTTEWDVEYELRDIRAFHKDARFYFEQEATITSLRKERGTLLHLAVEFQYDPRWPGNSIALFSDGLTRETVTGVQWGKFLSFPVFSAVVVSDLSRHSGIPPSKPLIFLMTGSKSVIMTAYPAHRKTKKYFGEIFYTSLGEGRPAGESYRNALLAMINNKEYSSPHVWGPFFLWGR
jgi:CHAT domain-containing protein